MLKAYITKQSERTWLTHADSLGDHIDNLNKELDVFRATFNRRVIYFAALQDLSDSVSAR